MSHENSTFSKTCKCKHTGYTRAFITSNLTHIHTTVFSIHPSIHRQPTRRPSWTSVSLWASLVVRPSSPSLGVCEKNECHSSLRRMPDWPPRHRGHWVEHKTTRLIHVLHKKIPQINLKPTDKFKDMHGVCCTSALGQCPDCHFLGGGRSADGRESSNVFPWTPLVSYDEIKY